MDLDLEPILERLRRKGALASELLPAYQTPEYADIWKADSTLYRVFTRGLIKEGHPTRAYELAREGRVAHPADLELTYLIGLAMARGGNISAAENHVAVLLTSADVEPRLRIEALSLQGRLHKDRFERTADPALKKRHAARSAATYLEAAEMPGADSFPRINAATMSLLAGEIVQAKVLAKTVIELASREHEQPGRADDYWVTATLGEAYFLLGDLAEAIDWYRKSVGKARERGALGDIGAMRRNLLFLKDKLEVSDELMRLFYVGSVVVFSGHMIDHPQRGTRDGLPPRFPSDPKLEARVREAIEAELEALNATIGICSAACGADLLFAECMLARSAELHVVLPFERNDFFTTSVDFGLPGEEWKRWRTRCEAVLARAELHHATTEPHLGDDVLFDFVSELSQGLACLRAAQRGVVPQALIVHDPTASRGRAGTADFLEQWRGRNLPATLIDLSQLREQPPRHFPTRSSSLTAKSSVPSPLSDDRLAREMKSMLFADVKNFSSLTDPFLPRFFLRFLGAVHEVIQTLTHPPLASHTWGDGLYLVFEHVTDCAEASLRLLERCESVDWADLGLGKDPPLRIGIHTGPVFKGLDPVIDRLNYFGSQVTRAARIEPVTIPGCAFASEQFAALLTIESGDEFVCEYIGVENLAKKYGRCPLYRLSRR